MLMRHARSSLAVSIVMVVAVVGGGGRLLSKNIGPSVRRKIYIIPRRNSGVDAPFNPPITGNPAYSVVGERYFLSVAILWACVC